MIREKPIMEMRGMEHLDPGKEEWIGVGVDDDGTEAFLDAASIVRDLDPVTLFKVWLKHVPPQGSKTYAELQQMAKAAKKSSGKPGYVRQVVEIDFAKDMSRNLHIVVCDNQGATIDVIDFRFPDWARIERGSIMDNVRDTLFTKFPDAMGDHKEPLKFSAPKVHPKPEHIEVSNRYLINAQPPKPADKLRLEEIDL
jgi:hypothetical protein